MFEFVKIITRCVIRKFDFEQNKSTCAHLKVAHVELSLSNYN